MQYRQPPAPRHRRHLLERFDVDEANSAGFVSVGIHTIRKALAVPGRCKLHDIVGVPVIGRGGVDEEPIGGSRARTHEQDRRLLAIDFPQCEDRWAAYDRANDSVWIRRRGLPPRSYTTDSLEITANSHS